MDQKDIVSTTTSQPAYKGFASSSTTLIEHRSTFYHEEYNDIQYKKIRRTLLERRITTGTRMLLDMVDHLVELMIAMKVGAKDLDRYRYDVINTELNNIYKLNLKEEARGEDLLGNFQSENFNQKLEAVEKEILDIKLSWMQHYEEVLLEIVQISQELIYLLHEIKRNKKMQILLDKVHEFQNYALRQRNSVSVYLNKEIKFLRSVTTNKEVFARINELRTLLNSPLPLIFGNCPTRLYSEEVQVKCSPCCRKSNKRKTKSAAISDDGGNFRNDFDDDDDDDHDYFRPPDGFLESKKKVESDLDRFDSGFGDYEGRERSRSSINNADYRSSRGRVESVREVTVGKSVDNFSRRTKVQCPCQSKRQCLHEHDDVEFKRNVNVGDQNINDAKFQPGAKELLNSTKPAGLIPRTLVNTSFQENSPMIPVNLTQNLRVSTNNALNTNNEISRKSQKIIHTTQEHITKVSNDSLSQSKKRSFSFRKIVDELTRKKEKELSSDRKSEKTISKELKVPILKRMSEKKENFSPEEARSEIIEHGIPTVIKDNAQSLSTTETIAHRGDIQRKSVDHTITEGFKSQDSVVELELSRETISIVSPTISDEFQDDLINEYLTRAFSETSVQFPRRQSEIYQPLEDTSKLKLFEDSFETSELQLQKEFENDNLQKKQKKSIQKTTLEEVVSSSNVRLIKNDASEDISSKINIKAVEGSGQNYDEPQETDVYQVISVSSSFHQKGNKIASVQVLENIKRQIVKEKQLEKLQGTTKDQKIKNEQLQQEVHGGGAKDVSLRSTSEEMEVKDEVSDETKPAIEEPKLQSPNDYKADVYSVERSGETIQQKSNLSKDKINTAIEAVKTESPIDDTAEKHFVGAWGVRSIDGIGKTIPQESDVLSSDTVPENNTAKDVPMENTCKLIKPYEGRIEFVIKDTKIETPIDDTTERYVFGSWGVRSLDGIGKTLPHESDVHSTVKKFMEISSASDVFTGSTSNVINAEDERSKDKTNATNEAVESESSFDETTESYVLGNLGDRFLDGIGKTIDQNSDVLSADKIMETSYAKDGCIVSTSEAMKANDSRLSDQTEVLIKDSETEPPLEETTESYFFSRWDVRTFDGIDKTIPQNLDVVGTDKLNLETGSAKDASLGSLSKEINAKAGKSDETEIVPENSKTVDKYVIDQTPDIISDVRDVLNMETISAKDSSMKSASNIGRSDKLSIVELSIAVHSISGDEITPQGSDVLCADKILETRSAKAGSKSKIKKTKDRRRSGKTKGAKIKAVKTKSPLLDIIDKYFLDRWGVRTFDAVKGKKLTQNSDIFSTDNIMEINSIKADSMGSTSTVMKPNQGRLDKTEIVLKEPKAESSIDNTSTSNIAEKSLGRTQQESDVLSHAHKIMKTSSAKDDFLESSSNVMNANEVRSDKVEVVLKEPQAQSSIDETTRQESDNLSIDKVIEINNSAKDGSKVSTSNVKKINDETTVKTKSSLLDKIDRYFLERWGVRSVDIICQTIPRNSNAVSCDSILKISSTENESQPNSTSNVIKANDRRSNKSSVLIEEPGTSSSFNICQQRSLVVEQESAIDDQQHVLAGTSSSLPFVSDNKAESLFSLKKSTKSNSDVDASKVKRGFLESIKNVLCNFSVMNRSLKTNRMDLHEEVGDTSKVDGSHITEADKEQSTLGIVEVEKKNVECKIKITPDLSSETEPKSQGLLLLGSTEELEKDAVTSLQTPFVQKEISIDDIKGETEDLVNMKIENSINSELDEKLKQLREQSISIDQIIPPEILSNSENRGVQAVLPERRVSSIQRRVPGRIVRMEPMESTENVRSNDDREHTFLKVRDRHKNRPKKRRVEEQQRRGQSHVDEHHEAERHAVVADGHNVEAEEPDANQTSQEPNIALDNEHPDNQPGSSQPNEQPNDQSKTVNKAKNASTKKAKKLKKHKL